MKRWPLRSHHVALIVLLAVFVIGSGLLTKAGGGGFDQGLVPSVDNRGQGGLRGLYLTCEGVGLEVDSWRRPTDLLDRSVRALVAVEAESSLPAGGDLLEWTRDGGRLLVTARTRLSPPWRSMGLVERGRGMVRPVEFRGAAEGWTEAGALTSSSLGFAPPLPPGARVLATVGEGDRTAPWLVEVPVGEGTLLALADARLLTNDRLKDPETAVAAVRLLEYLGREDPVLFCETLHGGAGHADPTAAFLYMLRTTPFGRATVAVSLFFLLFLLSGSSRFGRIRKTRETPRRSEHEYLEALGGLMHHERAWIDVGAFLREGLRRRLDPGGNHHGPPDDEEIVRQLAWDRPDARDSIARDVETLALGRSPAAMLKAIHRLDGDLGDDRAHLGGRTHDSR